MTTPTGRKGWHVAHKSILDAVRKNPGLGVRELARLTGHSGVTVSKHLAQLRSVGKVVALRDGARLCHFAPGAEKAAQRTMDALDRAILAELRREPLTLRQIQNRFVDRPRSTVDYRVKRLLTQGRLNCDPSWPRLLRPTAGN